MSVSTFTKTAFAAVKTAFIESRMVTFLILYNNVTHNAGALKLWRGQVCFFSTVNPTVQLASVACNLCREEIKRSRENGYRNFHLYLDLIAEPVINFTVNT